MAAPYPPQGNQSAHTERPLRVYAEQYLTGQPLPVGASTELHEPLYPNGEPRVYLPAGVAALHEGDWLLSNRYTGQVTEVISAEEFAERFGPSE